MTYLHNHISRSFLWQVTRTRFAEIRYTGRSIKLCLIRCFRRGGSIVLDQRGTCEDVTTDHTCGLTICITIWRPGDATSKRQCRSLVGLTPGWRCRHFWPYVSTTRKVLLNGCGWAQSVCSSDARGKLGMTDARNNDAIAQTDTHTYPMCIYGTAASNSQDQARAEMDKANEPSE
ncbi:hypothetical protein AUEXF2481DRAFT_182407 [Aureobasidium subglaciale EXF-2481]|uniref:Uncharacterized protein n=1 Tax=Aureobasidium subglaciale (strain EXF-2481) TaxID=1043005 RepID=A0A074ZMD2_AURSE|nr:uncharacterized protein AUEXF2481DRAFT_182407 [Aureobasidium subglaciale EXF-2481]KEQ99531.1 hypothetical protein AUEXF2481DRAFT_182407 [Aureobasidium subglaciale EXF-2481]